MLGAPCLGISSAWRAGGGVACLQRAGPLIAVGLVGGNTLLFAEPGLSSPSSELPMEGGIAAASPDGAILLGGTGDGRLVRIELAADQNPSPVFVELGAGADDSPAAAIAAQPSADVFAVAKGRYIHILAGSGSEMRRLGPLAQPAEQLGWVGPAGDVLVALTPQALLLWPADGEREGPVLPAPSAAAQFMCLAASRSTQMLAVSCGDGEVRCWDLAALLSSGADGCEPLRLGEFDSQPTCLGWSASGRFLATADGSDCVLWDLSDASGADRSSSTVCCGHEPRTAITALAFQEDGPMLATASSSGKVALFDCEQLRRGGVLAPAASTRLDSQSDDSVSALLWLPGGRLLVGAASGTLSCMQLVQPAPASPAGQSSSAAAATAALAASLAACSMADPLAGSNGGSSGGEAGECSTAEAPAAAAAAEAARAAAAALSRTASRSPAQSNNSSQQGGPSTPRAALAGGGQDSSAVQDEPELLPMHVSQLQHQHQQQRKHQQQEASQQQQQREQQQQQQQQAASHQQQQREQQSQYPQPPRVQPYQQHHHHTQQQMPMRQNSSGSGGSGATARRPRGARGGGGSRSGALAGEVPGGGPHGQPGFSPSLMHHIQAIRDHPPQGSGRSEHQPQLAGWGLGSPSGAHVPWMVAGGAGVGGGMPAGMPPGAAAASPGAGGGGYGQAAAGGVGFAPGFHGAQAAMFQQMSGMAPVPQVHSRALSTASSALAARSPSSVMQSPGGGPLSPGAYMPGAGDAAASPRAGTAVYAPGQAGMAVPPGAVFAAGPMGAGIPPGIPPGMVPPAQQQVYMAAAAVGGPGMGMAQQQMMAAHWMPYMQQVQQWAGTAPGYMVYQHGAVAAAGPAVVAASAGGMPQPVRLSGGGAPGMYAAGMAPAAAVPPGGGAALSPMNSGNWGSGNWSSYGGSSVGGSMGAPGAVSPRTSTGASSAGGMHSAFQQPSRQYHHASSAVPPAQQQQYRRMESKESTGDGHGTGRASFESDAVAAIADTSSNNRAGGSREGHARGDSGGSSGREEAQAAASRPAPGGRDRHATPSEAELEQQEERDEGSNNDDDGELLSPGASAAAAAAYRQDNGAQQRQERQLSRQPAAQQAQQHGERPSQQPQHASSPRRGVSAAMAAGPSRSSDLNNALKYAAAEGQGKYYAESRAGMMPAGMPAEPAAHTAGPAEHATRAYSASEDGSSQADGADGEAFTTVYVGNLPGTVDEYLLLCAFAPFGPITHVQVIKEKGSNLSRGYGFVSYAHPVYATVAMQQMNQQVLFGPFAGQRIKVAPSKRR